MTVLKAYIIGLVYAAVCLGLSMLLYKLGVEKKYTRKVVHILIGFEWIILSSLADVPYHLLIICLAFLALLLLTYRSGLMQMISSDGDNAPGTVYFCVSMSIMSLVAWIEPRFMIPFGIAVFCTSLGDGFAGVLGQAIRKFNPHIWKSKTLFGTLVSFALSLGVCLCFDKFYSLGLSIPAALSIALFAATLELVTGSGLDNITLPLGVAALSYFLIYYQSTALNYVIPVILTPLLLAVVVEKRVLTGAGVAAAVLLDLAVSVAFGNMGFIMVALFLVGGVAIDKVKARFRKSTDSVEGKNDKTRDIYQVLANGFPAILFSVAYIFRSHTVFLIAFSAAVAEAFSDTCASGFGALSKKTFDPFKMRRTEKGMSGGMSLIGTASSLVGALVISAVPVLFSQISLSQIYLVFVPAFAGALFDSLLGSLVQVKYRCKKCGAHTESKVHCGRKTERASGFTPIDNDAVNFISGAFASLLALVMYLPSVL